MNKNVATLTIDILANSGDAVLFTDEFSKIIGLASMDFVQEPKIIYINNVVGDFIPDLNKIIDIYGDNPNNIIILTLEPTELLFKEYDVDTLSEDKAKEIVLNYMNEYTHKLTNELDFVSIDNKILNLFESNRVYFIYNNSVGKEVYQKLYISGLNRKFNNEAQEQ